MNKCRDCHYWRQEYYYTDTNDNYVIDENETQYRKEAHVGCCYAHPKIYVRHENAIACVNFKENGR